MGLKKSILKREHGNDNMRIFNNLYYNEEFEPEINSLIQAVTSNPSYIENTYNTRENAFFNANSSATDFKNKKKEVNVCFAASLFRRIGLNEVAKIANNINQLVLDILYDISNSFKKIINNFKFAEFLKEIKELIISSLILFALAKLGGFIIFIFFTIIKLFILLVANSIRKVTNTSNSAKKKRKKGPQGIEQTLENPESTNNSRIIPENN